MSLSHVVGLLGNRTGLDEFDVGLVRDAGIVEVGIDVVDISCIATAASNRPRRR